MIRKYKKLGMEKIDTVALTLLALCKRSLLPISHASVSQLNYSYSGSSDGTNRGNERVS